MGCGVFNGPFFHLGNTAGHSDNHARTNHAAAVVNLTDEVTEHGFRDLEISNHTVFQGTNGYDVARRAAEHSLRFVADGKNAVGSLLHGHDRGFAENDTLVFHKDQRVGGPQINAYVA